jgi:soluble lytic murein transglycosylase
MAMRVALVATLLAGMVIAASDPNTAVRAEFLQAYATANADAITNASDSPALQAYELYPYLQAARFKRALLRNDRDVAALDQSIQTWLRSQGDAPVAVELRRLWLLDLAARQRWGVFLTNVPTNTNDAEIRCLQASAVLNSNPAPEQIAMISRNLAAVWMKADRLPGACNAPFDWARSHQVITTDLIEQRARLALKAGNSALARDLADMLSATQAEPLRQWITLIEKPQDAIDALIAHPHLKVEPAALQDGWFRLARKDQDAALQRLPRLVRAMNMNATIASPYALNLALALAWNRRTEALSYFARVASTDMTEQAYEWQARAALWVSDWPRVEQSITVMPDALRTQARWRYWLARAKQQRKDEPAAQALYQALIANDDNYYAAMAAARMQQRYAPHAQPLPDNSVTTTSLATLPGMQRAHELLVLQLRDAAMAEWTQVFAALQPGEHLAAAQLAHDWGWYDQAVTATARLGLYNDYVFLYPQPYATEVAAAAKLSGVSTDLIYGVMRQETLFRPDAQSAANARGLLQLLPETARITARKYQLPVPSADQLFDPAINVPLGAAYLKSLLDSFDGQWLLALAAYNAGPAATRRWLPARAMESDIWMENIPYNETRGYVQRVLWHSLVFHWLRENQPLDTGAWLAPVQP